MVSSGQQEDRTPSMVTTVRAVVSTVALLSLLVCGTRLYLRKFVLNAFGIDDYLVIIALVLAIGFAILSIIITFYGIGYHQDTVPEEKLPTMQLIVYVSLCAYLFVAAAVKTSVTVFVMRIFPKKSIRRIGLGIIGFLVALTISGEFPLIFQCKPVRAAYDPTVTSKVCFSSETLFGITMYQGVLMFLVDVVIIILPMPTIWKLQMPVRRRQVIAGIFALGTLACIAALVRLPTLKYQNDSTDYTYSASKSMIWMNVEFNLGLIVGSLPSLAKLPVLNSLLSPNSSQGLSGSFANNALSSGSRGQGGHPLHLATWEQKFLKRESRTGNESCERMIKTPESNHR